MNTISIRKILACIAIVTAGLATILVILYWAFAPRQDSGVTRIWTPYKANSELSIDHSQWQTVLDDYLILDEQLDLNLFDYQGLIDDESGDLNAYINQLNKIDPRHYTRAEQFAYWVNLYNALTVKVVIENYPISSIKEIGNSPFPTGPWDDPATEIAGQSLTLNDIEHSILRPIWQDYRIHFAVNCASIGCPDLQEIAFNAHNTQQLLEAAATSYLSHKRGLYLDQGHLTLSSIFNWYDEDFGNNEKGVVNTLISHLPVDYAAKIQQFNGKVQYNYDWNLNQAR